MSEFGIPDECVLAAYEDPLEQLLAEVRLPAGAPVATEDDPTPDSAALASAATRAALSARIDAAHGRPAAYVVPLHWNVPEDPDVEPGWGTAKWRLRRGALYLLPGDSPAGLRLPLSSIAWTPPPGTPDRSPFSPTPPLPPAIQRESATGRMPQAGRMPQGDGPKPAVASTTADASTKSVASETTHTGTAVDARTAAPPTPAPAPHAVVVPVEDAPTTALVAQLRDGHVHVFLPPVADADTAVLALQRVEAAAASAGVPVVLEGYLPPHDPRLAVLVVAPDPGVLEVNVQPAASWDELVAINDAVAAEARAVRLGTETFGLDGRHSGTGGGSHLTVGGRTPADSPLLRRPDLLRSMLTFWQHHPSLSYLFSGRFIGPTSQAPRVDEGRHDALYELETSFAELDHQHAKHVSQDAVPANNMRAENMPTDEEGGRPWLVDRLFRHLLIDVTGNTHRAEFCIDKLFSPDSERGRLGLLELRGFEMAPHPRMALVQALLVRSLIARFWKDEYRAPLVRWGTTLHDRFLLPWFCHADALEVVNDLRAHGFAFDPAWLDPFVEFRFPIIGETMIAGVHLELRSAIEPWHVLGEETASTGTARYVDSSVERLQVLARNLVPGRHAVAVNGVLIPLHPTGAAGTAVAGVRYRAWQPPSALHPTIPVDSPLVFDLVDLWNGRSLGGCTYHVVHPGGRAYEQFPVNAAEAESRRSNRFIARGHTPGPFAPARLTHPGTLTGAEYPLCVDLRRAPRAEPGT